MGFGSVSRRSARCAATCGRLGGRRRRVARIGSGSGRRSLVACRAKTPPWRAACRRRSGPGGSVRLAGCHRSRSLRCRADTCRSPNGRRSQSCTHRRSEYVRSLAGSVGRHRRSRGSCAATPPLARIDWSIGPRRPSGTRSAEPAARRSPSSLRTRDFASTCRTVSPARSPDLMASSSRDPRCAGSVVGMAAAETAAGPTPRVPSRSRIDCASTPHTIASCGSRMRRSTRRSTSRAGAR